jgi:phage terminase large subunit
MGLFQKAESMTRPKVSLPKLVGGGYDGFWKTRKRYRVNKGGRASKKSCDTSLWFIYNMMKFYHAYNVKPCLLVIRRYFNTHRNSTRAQLIWAIHRLGVSHLWKIPKGEHTLTYIPSGQVILFRGMDDPDSITSITVTDGYLVWCWIEEAYQIHNEADFDKLDMSFRGEVPYPLFKQLTLTFNPWSDTTWIKARFFDNPDDDTFTLTTTYLQNEFLGDDDRAIFEKMRVNNPRRYAIEGLGQWGLSVGQIYLNFAETPEKYCIETVVTGKEDENYEWQKKIALISVGLDYGTGDGTGPVNEAKKGKTVLQATAITEGFSKIYCIDEAYFKAHYRADEVSQWVIDFLVKLKEEWKLPIILYAEWAGSDSVNRQIQFDLQKKGITGIRITNCYKSSIIDRIDLSQILIGEKRMFFTDKVPGLKAAYKTALWDTKKGKEKGIPVRLDDGTTDIDSLDAHEYSFTAYLNYLLAYQPKEPKTYKHGLQVIGG